MGRVVHLGRSFMRSPVSFDVTDVEVADYSATNASEFEAAHSSVVRCFADADGEDAGEEIARLVFHGVVLDESEAATIALAVQDAFTEIERTRETNRTMDALGK